MDFRGYTGAATSTRNYVVGLHSRILHDQDIVDRIAITVHELTENLIKYASTQCSTLDIALHLATDFAHFHVRTCNSATQERLSKLKEVFELVTRDADPIDLYDEAIERSLAAGGDWSGLGLARIRAEAGMLLTYEIVGNEVTIDASWSGALKEPCDLVLAGTC
jgi:hypothetical protein